MKKMMILAMMMVMTVSANAMNYTQAKNEALFLSDKMAYELNLTNAQYDAVYEINLDYLMSVNGKNDLYGVWWNRRNTDLQYVLTVYQYNKYVALSYFYRPLSWSAGSWTFNIYNRYTNRSKFYTNRPAAFTTYKGGNNRKSQNYYANKNFTHTTKVVKTTSKTSGSVTRSTTNVNTKTVTTSGGHFGNGRPTAQNTSKSGTRSFGGRR